MAAISFPQSELIGQIYRVGGNSARRSPRSVQTLVVIDAGVTDYAMLAAGVLPGNLVLIVDRHKDGIAQITQALRDHRNLTTLHLMAHGDPGCLYLGNSQLSLETIDRYAWDLTGWFASLQPDSVSLLLYGCQVAAGDRGSEFLNKLHYLTEARIAASTTLIGRAAEGGNWELDVTTGAIELAPVFQPEVLETYPHTLNNTYHLLSGGALTQDWSNPGLITANNDWSSVPSIIGYRGDNLTNIPGTDPQTILADGNSTPINVTANQANPDTQASGGVAEFQIVNPTIALQGSGTADAPFLLIHLDTTGVSNVQVSYNLRDIDGAVDNAISQMALQYRVGETGNFINIPAGYVADASTGPSLATLATPVSITLPSDANNQPKVQLRIIAADAVGADEWIGIDDINISATPGSPGSSNTAPVLSGNATLTAIDEDITNIANTGTKVSDLIAGKITDVNGDPEAIVVTNVDNTNGNWQYSTDGGATWTDFGTISETNAVTLGATSLYNATLGTAPASQNWLSFANVTGATQTANGNGTVLDTTANNSIYAGYSNYNGATLVNANFPKLDNVAGYSISFNLQMLAESFTDTNRAGFSLVVVSQDATKSIELGFHRLSATTGNIFAQEGNGATLFTAAENVSYDTNQSTDYKLQVVGDNYILFANGVQILTGALRNYSSFVGAIDPYETSNFVFLGDDTTSAQGKFNLSQVVVQTDTRVRFVPNTDYNGTAAIDFRAWDTTNGLANGATGVDASLNGGTTAFSNTKSTATITVNSVNDSPTGNVIVTGTATEDQTLTANTSSIQDVDGLGIFSYQWQESSDGTAWTDITGETASTFTPDDPQVSKQIRVVISYTDQQNTAEKLNSNPTSAISSINDSPTGTVTISSTATEGQTLTVDASAVQDVDGLGAFSYQWQLSSDGITWTDITGETASTFTPDDPEVGKQVRVVVSYPDKQGTLETLNSNATSAVSSINDASSGSVKISSTATEEQTLTADASSIQDVDGLGTFSYQWQESSDGTTWIDITNAISDAFMPDDPQVGKQIRVVVSYTDRQGTLETLNSNATSAVTSVNDSPTGNVTIDGNPAEGETLTVNTSNLSDNDGLGTLSYQWQLSYDGSSWSDIAGATDKTFTPDDPQVDQFLQVKLSYTDQQGTQETIDSETTTLTIANVNDLPIGKVTINGDPIEGKTLTATANINDADGLGVYSYQWQQSLDGKTWSDISGAVTDRFTPAGQQVGQQVRVRISYSDGQGTDEVVDSIATAAIVDITAPVTPKPVTLETETGVSLQDRITNNNQPRFSGVGEPGGTIQIYANQILLGTTQTNLEGKWNFTSAALLDGNYEIFFTVTDPSGNESNSSPKLTLTIDTKAATASIFELNPKIRESGADSITIQFDQAIASFDLEDLILVHNGNPVSLAGASLSTTDNITWRLDNLAALTSEAGQYQLILKAGSVTDIAGNLLASTAKTHWLTGYTGAASSEVDFSSSRSGRANKGIRLTGGNRNDRLQGTPNNDVIKGSKGDDMLIGGFGKFLFGIDRLYGEAGNDKLIGGKGVDLLDGGQGKDQLKGDKGRDLLLGGSENDRLLGGKDNDILVGGAGKDLLIGGAGRDMFICNSISDGTDTIKDFTAEDLLDLRSIFTQPQFAGINAFAQFMQYVKFEQVGADVNVNIDLDGSGAETMFGTLFVLKNTALETMRSQQITVR